MSEAEDLKEVKGEEDNSSSWSDNLGRRNRLEQSSTTLGCNDADLNSVQQPSAAIVSLKQKYIQTMLNNIPKEADPLEISTSIVYCEDMWSFIEKDLTQEEIELLMKYLNSSIFKRVVKSGLMEKYVSISYKAEQKMMEDSIAETKDLYEYDFVNEKVVDKKHTLQ